MLYNGEQPEQTTWQRRSPVGSGVNLGRASRGRLSVCGLSLPVRSPSAYSLRRCLLYCPYLVHDDWVVVKVPTMESVQGRDRIGW